MSRYIEHGNEGDDEIDRRGFLKCMAWAGTGVVFALSGCGEVATSRLGAHAAPHPSSSFTFVQISDSHVGFGKPANPDVVSTLQQCIARINALPQRPSFVVHTGDHVHLSTPEEFDTVKQLLGTIKTGHVFHVPGEHDVFVDQGKRYRQFFGKGSHGTGYYSFDYKGVHFLALANVQASESETGAGGMNGLGRLGAEQIAFVKRDLAHRSSDTPLVIFGHVPLLAVYPKWGWATEDSAQVLKLMKRFSSVTVLNGHIHQVLAKHEGRITMHTANSTAFPQHSPGDKAPGAFDLPAGELPGRLGIRSVRFVRGTSSLALTDQTLA